MEIKHLIEAFLALLVGLSLFPAVNSASVTAAANATAGSASAVLLPIVPLVYVVILVAGAAAYVYSKR